MVTVSNGNSFCEYMEAAGRFYVSINGYPVMELTKERFDDDCPQFLTRIYVLWIKKNYPSFWRNPKRWLVGGPLDYNLFK